MRIRNIRIDAWRNFHGINIQLPDDSPLVCLVGANGTGKTHILELISACAHHIGLSSGIEIPRGDPFNDEVRQFQIEFFLAKGVSDALDTPFDDTADYAVWDRTVTLDGESSHLSAGGVTDAGRSKRFAQQVVQVLRQSQQVHHLTLDADRAFPRRDLQIHELAQAFEINWNDTNWNKGRAFQTTRTLYDEWIKYCLAKENKSANNFYQAARRANELGSTPPKFVDTFKSYRESLRKVMPHLLFAGADQERKAILFDTSGMELRFDQLSGGEREIAFLVGQIDRFGLKNGIFLLDEPELHLNPDLVRAWVTYLGSTVTNGQVWLATHSLEAVEASGLATTVLLERDPDTKAVNSVGSLSERPVLSALSRAVGTPAFSISGLRFVFIEGEEEIGERERYRRVTDMGADTRFIECGSCSEVMRRLEAIQDIAEESEQPIRIAGIIDRDWRSNADLDKLTAREKLIALPVHEVENFFLHEATLTGLATQMGNGSFDYAKALVGACDGRAGGWIIQSALSDETVSDISNLPGTARQHAYRLTWGHIQAHPAAAMREIGDKSGFEEPMKLKLVQRLEIFAKMYGRKREETDLWKVCEGKEIMKVMSKALGFSDHYALERAVSAYWAADESRLPEELRQLRKKLIAT